MKQGQGAECQEVSRHLPDICHLSGGGQGTALGERFVHSRAHTSPLWASPPLWVSLPSSPAVCWLVSIYRDRHLLQRHQHTWHNTGIFGPPGGARDSARPNCCLLIPVSVHRTPSRGCLRLGCQTYFPFLVLPRSSPSAFRVNRCCSLQPSHTHAFLFFSLCHITP